MQTFLKLSKNKKFYILIALIFFTTTVPLTAIKAQTLESKISEIMKTVGSPGIQISYKNKNTSKNIALGVLKYGEPQPVTLNTRFQAASLTKVVTAYAFFRLMDQGLIDLDTPLLHYYAYDRLKNTKEAEKITARMVLTHHSGLLNWEGDVPSAEWRATPLTLQFSPGTDYKYSGEGFYFLQETMEHLTGKPFKEIIEEQVFIPLGMHKSNIVWNDSLANATAYGHYAYNKPRKLGTYRKSNAAYTLYTTSTDYLKFIQKALIKGENLKKDTHKTMLSRSAEAKKETVIHPDDKYVPCALGLRMQINEKGTAYWHTGSNPGFRCFFIVYPQSGEILTVFMNTDTGFPAMKSLMTLFLLPNQTFWAYDWRKGELD